MREEFAVLNSSDFPRRYLVERLAQVMDNADIIHDPRSVLTATARSKHTGYLVQAALDVDLLTALHWPSGSSLPDNNASKSVNESILQLQGLAQQVHDAITCVTNHDTVDPATVASIRDHLDRLANWADSLGSTGDASATR